MVRTLWVVPVIALLIVGCGPVAVAPGATATPTAPPGAADALAGTHWRLESFGAVGAESLVIAGSTLTLEFGVDGQAGGSAGCNSFGGKYQVRGDTLAFSEIVSTLRDCSDRAVMEGATCAGQADLVGQA